MRWRAALANGSSDTKCGSTEYATAGGDSGQRDQSRPDAAVCGELRNRDRERAGMRVSQFAGAADGDSDYVERPAGRRQRDGAGGELSAAGRRWQVFSDWGFTLYARERMGDCESSGGLASGGAERSCSGGCAECRGQRGATTCAGSAGWGSEADGEQEGLALQSVSRRGRSTSWAQVRARAGDAA